MPKGRFLGEFEIYVLLAVARLGPDAYGITIRRDIESRTGREVAIGAVYATLGRLQDKSFVTTSLSAPQPIPGGRSRKHFHLTTAGRRALAHSTSMLARMMAGVDPGLAGGRAK
jgi:DNA-binding PadR family transcriptional regulator